MTRPVILSLGFFTFFWTFSSEGFASLEMIFNELMQIITKCLLGCNSLTKEVKMIHVC
jgi:hypothetical protein